jgi:acyl carrier protein
MSRETTSRDSVSEIVLDTLGRIAPDVDAATLDPGLAFRDQFEIDSVDFLNFVIGLEKRLNQRIPEADFPRLSSLNGCLDYLGRSDGSSK